MDESKIVEETGSYESINDNCKEEEKPLPVFSREPTSSYSTFTSEDSEERRRLLPGRRTGDVISPHRALVTLAKCFFNAGCFSLPYAWKKGGLWVSFAGTFLIAVWNCYGSHILVSSAQHLATVTKKPALDYGHFAKKVLDHSDISWFQKYSKQLMYVVNVTIIFYQVGMCGVAILFIATNMRKAVTDFTDIILDLKIYVTIALCPIMLTNMVAPFKFLSIFALFSSVFFLGGTSVVLYFCWTLPSQWASLPASTDFISTLMFFGIAMYAFEGQTMILPIENKMRHPEDFLYNCGVLHTTYCLCACLMTALGFYGYTALGDAVENPITLNLPKGFIYTMANVLLMLQAMLGHCLALYAVLDMLWYGFNRKLGKRYPTISKYSRVVAGSYRVFWVLVTYFLALLVPSLDLLVPLVGVSSGTLCAIVYPAFFELVHFRNEWKEDLAKWKYLIKFGINSTMITVGLFAVVAGLYANIGYIIEYYSS